MRAAFALVIALMVAPAGASSPAAQESEREAQDRIAREVGRSEWARMPIKNVGDCFAYALAWSQRVGSPPIGEDTVDQCKAGKGICLIVWKLNNSNDALLAHCAVDGGFMSVRKIEGFFKPKDR